MAEAPGSPPASLDVQATVDGWRLPLDTRRVRRPWMGPVALGTGGVGGVTVAGIVVGQILGVFDGSAASMGWLAPLALGLLVTTSAALALAITALRPVRVVVSLAREALIVEGLPGGRRRVPWERVAPPRVGDARDTWQQAFDLAHAQLDPSDPSITTDRPVPGVHLRWTTDGQAAAYAHGGTDWERLILAGSLRHDEAAWLARAIDHFRAAAVARRREAAFDAVVAGDDGDAARQALDALRGRESG